MITKTFSGLTDVTYANAHSSDTFSLLSHLVRKGTKFGLISPISWKRWKKVCKCFNYDKKVIVILDDLAASPNRRFQLRHARAVKKALGLMADIFVSTPQFQPPAFAALS